MIFQRPCIFRKAGINIGCDFIGDSQRQRHVAVNARHVTRDRAPRTAVGVALMA